MKQIIKNYAFDKTAKTVTFSDFASIRLDRLQLITNVTANTIIYQFNDSTLGGSAAGNVLTLGYNTGSMNNTDKLQIIYDCAAGDPTYDLTAAGGQYNASAPTLTNGQHNELQLDSHGNLNVNLATALVAEDSTNNAFRTEGTYQEVSGLSAGALTADLVPSTDVSMFKWLTLQITGTYSGTLTFQGSLDGSTWSSVALANTANVATSGTTTTTASGIMYHGPVAWHFFRVRMTAYTSGTATGTLDLYTLPAVQHSIGAQVSANSSTGSALPATAFYQGLSDGTNLRGALSAADGLNSTGAGVQATQMVAQFDDTSPTAITENQFGNVRMSANRNQYVTIRDGGGNERGVTVTAAGALLVDGSGGTQAISGNVGSASATGAAFPANAFPMGGSDGTNLVAVRTATTSLNAASGILGAAMVAQLDEISPTAITENQFGNVRMSPRRALTVRGEDQNSRSYSAATSITLAATPTDVLTITGSSSNTIYITKIIACGTKTAAGLSDLVLVRRSAVDSGGTSASVTPTAHNQSDAAVSATVLAYTANPTLGTSAGVVRWASLPFADPTTAVANTVTFDFGAHGRPIVLSGTSDQLAINLQGATLTGGIIRLNLEWYEA